MAQLDLGISREVFLSQFFEKKFLFSKHAVDSLTLRLADINRVLYAMDGGDPALRLFLDGVVSADQYVTHIPRITGSAASLEPEAIRSLLGAGATLILNRIDQKVPEIGDLCAAISAFTGEHATANAYLAFGGPGTFGKHWDTHDVFALQLIGAKKWKLFAPTFLSPLPNQTSKYCKDKCPQNPVFECTLEAGDLLYIPRGYWHEVVPLPDQLTLHVSIGLHTLKAIDYLNWLSSHCLPEFVELRQTIRKGLPCKPITDALLQVLKSELNKQTNIDEFFRVRPAPGPDLFCSFFPTVV